MQDDLSRIGLIRTLFHDWQEKTALAEQLEVSTQWLKALLAVVETARKDYVDGLLQTISNDVARMYVAMHPDEDVGDVRFSLDPRYPGSLTFDGRFGLETNIPPRLTTASLIWTRSVFACFWRWRSPSIAGRG